MQRPTVGLALGAGAAKGMAHLGVLMVLEEEKIPVHVIAGTSIGSVFGALYADNADLNLVAKMACTMRHQQFVDIVLPKMGLIKGEKIEELFKVITKNKNFNELAKPFFAIAADIETGEEVVINTGKVADALRASVSIPGIFKPKRIANRLLVDGAVKNHVPINILRLQGADYIIAVDVRFGGRIGGKHNVQTIFDVILMSLEITHFEHVQRLCHECNALIQPDLSHISPTRFDRAEECIELGIGEARRIIPAIKKDLQALGVI
ncbi:MAG: hypothetical protein APF76_05115 [Desulfitibacter sp. BRH_c19]|nr:MAG: hypothetical protein APF76_05115 [Desulfitibacter sp. BRH_c19]